MKRSPVPKVNKCNKAISIPWNFKQFPVRGFFHVSLLFLEGAGQKASRGYKTLMNTTTPFSPYPIKRTHPLRGCCITHGCTSWSIPPLEKLSDRGLTSAALSPKYTIQNTWHMWSTFQRPLSVCMYIC
jgi:hypothetical protein